MDSVSFRQANIDDAHFIACGFHMAMLVDNPDEDSINIFAENVCNRHDVLYSSDNTFIAEVDGIRAGMITAYDGAKYHDWRVTTMGIIDKLLGKSFPGMEDEAVPGEYYIDSLAVWPEFRGNGIGRKLLQKAIEEGLHRGLDVTLAVDPVNERAQKLYESLGFRRANDLFIFGHTYWKMVIRNK